MYPKETKNIPPLWDAECLLLPESADDVEDEGEHDTEKKRGGNRKIEGRVLSAIENIPRQTTDRQACAAEKQEDYPQDKQNNAEESEKFSEFRHHKPGTRHIANAGHWVFRAGDWHSTQPKAPL